MDRIERKLRNLSQPKTLISNGIPSIAEMEDGEQRFAFVPGKKLRLYFRNGNKLYFTQFTSVEDTGSNWEELL